MENYGFGRLEHADALLLEATLNYRRHVERVMEKTIINLWSHGNTAEIPALGLEMQILHSSMCPWT